MEKNVKILDVNGIEVGFTYPKRAKGLVKNGRALYVDDCTIRFLHTIDPTTIEYEENSEGDYSMNNNIICFNARDFRIDKSFENSVGSRMFITDMFGESVEVFEIGDGKDNATQIQAIKSLEANTDYVFRFALTTSKDIIDGITQFAIVPIAGEEETEDDWENRYVFNLSQNQYKAAVTKLWGINLIRVYEVPFNTYDATKFRFVFMAKNAVARVYPAKELESYSHFQDFSYSGWFTEKKEQFEKFGKEFDVNKTIKEAGEATKKATDIITEKLKGAYEDISKTVKNATSSNKTSNETSYENHRNENLDENAVATILQKITDNGNVNFSNCNITDSTTKTVDQGGAKDGVCILACNSNIQGHAFATILSKVGDGSELDFSNSNISELAVASTITPACGANIVMKNSNISLSSFSTLMTLIGDGCNLDIQSSVITDDGSDFGFGEAADGVNINATFAVIPERVKEKIKARVGAGNQISGI